MNQEFAPSEDEVRRAQALVEAYEAALAQGLGAIEVDGRMVDEPVAARARELLALQQRIALIR